MHSRRGITLVEMVVVVAIIALIVAISFPAATAGLENVRMVSAGDSVATFLNAAVNRAERHQQPVELIISRKDGTLDVVLQRARLHARAQDAGRRRDRDRPARGRGHRPTLPRRILFLPGATIPAIGIQLSNRRNTHRLVRLDPMTGFPRIEAVSVQ